MAEINKLTDKAIQAAKPREKEYPLSDGNNLYLIIKPSGRKLWRFRYRYNGSTYKMHALIKALDGSSAYPEISLKEARLLRDEAKKFLANGIDPAAARREAKTAEQKKEAHTFRNIAEEWFATWRQGKAHTTVAHVRSRLDRFILPGLGDMPVADITGPEILEILRPIEAKGQDDTTQRVKINISLILEFSIATGRRALANPCPYLGKVLKQPEVKSHAAFTRPEQVAELMRAIDGYQGQSIFVRAALRLLPLVFVRPGELRTAKWVDIDLDQAEWKYTVSKTKTEHLVPLSRQAVAILRELKALSSAGPYVFPGVRSDNRPISDMTTNRALQGMGYDTKSEITGHGFRAMARTMLAERLHFQPEVIEHQLAHKVPDALGNAYNRTKYLEQRREMMQAWADYLDDLKNDPAK